MLVTSNKMQASQKNSLLKSESGYENSISTFLTILKKEGFVGLYSGFNSLLVGTAYTNAIYYYFYEFFNEKITSLTKHKPLHIFDNILVAALSGVLCALASNPIWVINTRASTKSNESLEKSDILHVAYKIASEEGIGSLWSGIIPALILVTNPIINYVLFERLRLLFKNEKLPGWKLFLLSAFTKMIAALITHPYLVIKTRLQAVNNVEKYKNLIDCIEKTYKNEGFAGFWKGLSTKLLHSVLTSALLFLIKDKTTLLSIKLWRLLSKKKIISN